MQRPNRAPKLRTVSVASSRGFTLIEILVSTALTLILMAAVVTMFGSIGKSVNESRSTLEMSDRLRTACAILQKDLAGATVTVLPPRRLEDGYFEYIEGPIGDSPVMLPPSSLAVNNDPSAGGSPDGTVIDNDDRLLFTTRSIGRPFVGRCQWAPGGTIQSDVAEVAWFVRGRTLYRRVLLVAPWVPYASMSSVTPVGFYNRNDVSVRVQGSTVIANTLADLTRRENRFAHDVRQFPFDARGWGQLGLPLLQECSTSGWTVGRTPAGPAASKIDYWSNNPYPAGAGCDPDTGATVTDAQARVSEDVILTNVIGFDVKVYEPAVGNYVDLGWNPSATPPQGYSYYFNHLGDQYSGLMATGSTGTPASARVYDTGTNFYDYAGRNDMNVVGGISTNGFDDVGAGVVDGSKETVAPPPYPTPLRGIQIKIRTFEPDSRQVREMTVVQDFLPK